MLTAIRSPRLCNSFWTCLEDALKPFGSMLQERAPKKKIPDRANRFGRPALFHHFSKFRHSPPGAAHDFQPTAVPIRSTS